MEPDLADQGRQREIHPAIEPGLQCHQPGGSGAQSWDARPWLTLDETHLINGQPADVGGDPANKLIVPGDIAHSIVLQRILGNGFSRMPPLATHQLDLGASNLLTAWITIGLTNQTFADWQIVHFGSTNAPNAAPNADPDGDRLLYSLYFRGEDESQWKLLRANMTENTYLLEGDVFADGRYYFRVTASDRPSNPAEFARNTELISTPVVYDGKVLRHFINGEKEMEGPVDFPPSASGKMSLGVRLNRVYWYKGAIGEVRFHPRALEGAELQKASSK